MRDFYILKNMMDDSNVLSIKLYSDDHNIINMGSNIYPIHQNDLNINRIKIFCKHMVWDYQELGLGG